MKQKVFCKKVRKILLETLKATCEEVRMCSKVFLKI